MTNGKSLCYTQKAPGFSQAPGEIERFAFRIQKTGGDRMKTSDVIALLNLIAVVVFGVIMALK